MLSPTALAATIRDMAGDGSIGWVAGPISARVLLDAADMLDEFADAPKCEICEAMLDCDECLRADASQKERKRLDYENAKLRELVRVMAYCMQHERDCDGCRMNGADGTIEERCGCGELLDRLRELGVVA